MKRIFISYRRSISHYSVSILGRWLAEHFGPYSFFLDTGVIRPGDLFPARIRNAVADCKVFLPLFGKGWETLRNDNGEIRIQLPEDWVRMEIEAALVKQRAAIDANEKPILIIPLIEVGAEQPSISNLPESLRDLSQFDSLRYESAESLNSILAIIDSYIGGVPMGKFGMRILAQGHDPSSADRYRFRYAKDISDLNIFVDMSDNESAIAGAHPDLSGDERLQLYMNWAQWTAPDLQRKWTEEGNHSKAFVILDKLQEDGSWMPIGVSIMLSLTLQGVKHLLQKGYDQSPEDDASAVTLSYGDLSANSNRVLLDTWIIRPRKTPLKNKTPRVEHAGWGRTLELRHLAELLNFKDETGGTILCEPDNKLIAKMLEDLGFLEEKRSSTEGKLYLIRYPLNEEIYESDMIHRFNELMSLLSGLRHSIEIQ